ncbi:MAG: imidazole glycerol phosphate synthase subunit HisH [Spirochaetota bacterium]
MITIIDLGISNIKSITRGFITQGFDIKPAYNARDVMGAASVVLPGVGAFPRAVKVLRQKGIWEPLLDHARQGKPLLGVCLGMQLLCTDSEEHRFTRGLGLIPGHIVRFPMEKSVPHMGWNQVVQTAESPIFKDVPSRADFYFVHSYYVRLDDEQYQTACTEHFIQFPSAVQNGNIFGLQFHPEKSQHYGLRILKNFALVSQKWNGKNLEEQHDFYPGN